ncbi:MAG TPA: cob(I)yrinic acid a,c-diamide adenosyltransferase [Rectinemataceae bacterium]|nr:cob(I)yrinic acid a,c-diamide adenosyltransferase [Rectinemataceae bacterium]
MSIVTKTGDGGLTSLWSGERVRKDDPRVEAYGTIDELSSQLGLARHSVRLPATLAAIESIQRDLVRAGGELASRGKPFGVPLGEADVEAVTEATKALEAKVALTGFVLPGMTAGSAALDVARAVSRRAERRVLSLAREVEVSGSLRVWLNRLSDWLFMLARAEEAAEGKLTFAPRFGSGEEKGEAPP